MTDDKRPSATAAGLYAVAAALIVNPALAEEESAGQFIVKYESGSLASQRLQYLILEIMQDGFGWYSVRSKVRLYCQPDKLALTGAQAFDILSRSVQGDRSLADEPVGQALLTSLQRTFPCNGK